VRIRRRREADLAECVRLAEVVHAQDNYPLRLPGNIRAFLVSGDAMAAWVAEEDGEVVGHVALHPRSHSEVVHVASEATGLPEDHHAVIARLLVAPRARRQGVGRGLLDVAAAEARARGLRPVLDVVTAYHGAMRLYEQSGWTRAGQITFRFPDGETVEEFVYLGPT
jgi:GNAT superfamily N-acetyltransferase